jgi:branched-chain amino acid aminotransferase
MNGNFLPESEAKISIYDSALMFGDMVFEMTRSFNSVQFKLEEHFERLFYGLKILRIEIPYSKSDLISVCHEIQSVNSSYFEDNDEHRLLIDVSRGLLGIYRDVVSTHPGPNVIVADFPLRWTVRGMGKLFNLGINAVITSQRAIPSQYLDPKIKNRSRLFYLNANIEASLFSGERNWALLLDSDGLISEGTGDNFFIVKNGQIITPRGKNILRGISRDYVLNTLASDLEIQAIEKDIEPYDVYTADEAFMTGTPFCMLPVTSLNDVPIGDGKVGETFNKLLLKWSQNVGVDIKDQIIKWDLKNTDSTVGPTPYSFKPSKNS